MSPMTQQAVAESMFRLVEPRLGGGKISSRFQRDRYLELCSLLIGEIEISMTAAKDLDFE